MTQMKARLQLRWEKASDDKDEFGYRAWHCHYELVLPLGALDIRREDADCKPVRDELVVPIKEPTVRNSVNEPCRLDDGSLHYDPPYRDGSHALWDSKLLGDLPIVVVAIDGTVIARPEV